MAKSGLAPRRHHDAGEVRELRQQMRGGRHQLMRAVGVQFVFELVDLALLERLDDHQAVDEETVALRRRHAAGRRVRTRDEAHLLEVGHHVADRRRRQLEAGLPRQRARADRLAVGDVALDQRLQQVGGARIEHSVHCSLAAGRLLDRTADSKAVVGCGLIAAMPAPPTRFPRIALVGRHATPGHRRAARAHRRVPRRARPRGRARGGNGAVHAAAPAIASADSDRTRHAAPTSRSCWAATARCCRSRAGSRRTTSR